MAAVDRKTKNLVLSHPAVQLVSFPSCELPLYLTENIKYTGLKYPVVKLVMHSMTKSGFLTNINSLYIFFQLFAYIETQTQLTHIQN